MPDGNQRIEVLEDEMKVLKGEVSRTLVDLRALLMREESPLMTGGLLKRVQASANQAPSITAQLNLAPATETPATNISIAAPTAPDQQPSALAGLPSLGGIEMPDAPGAPDGALFPSQGNEISVPAASSPADEIPAPSAPSSGDISSPSAEPKPAAASSSGWEEERDEERAQQRKARVKEEDAQDEQRRARRRENELTEDRANQERRDRRRKEVEDDDQRKDRKRDEEREDDKRRNRRRDDEGEDDKRNDRRRRNDDNDDRRENRKRDGRVDSYEAELEEELDRFSKMRRRGEELEDEMERLSNLLPSEDDFETSPDDESGSDPLDQDEEDGRNSMDLDDSDMDFDSAKDDGYESDERSDDYLSDTEADADQDLDDELEDALDTGGEDETGYEYDSISRNGHSDDREENLGYPLALGPEGNFDSHEYQEEPKINGNNGSRRNRRQDGGRRSDEDSYHQDHQDRQDRQDRESRDTREGWENRDQEFAREPQYAPRSQRMSGPNSEGRGDPRGRRPVPGNYEYGPDRGNGQWGPPPAGYQQWPAPQEWAPEPSPMDLNLVSSLVRWASLAKYRVGEKRLSDIIDLYVESRSATAGLKEALTHIASIVDDQPPESGQSAQETLDLIAHLHGILTAALPVPEVPKIHSQINFIAGKGNGNGKGDW